MLHLPLDLLSPPFFHDGRLLVPRAGPAGLPKLWRWQNRKDIVLRMLLCKSAEHHGIKIGEGLRL